MLADRRLLLVIRWLQLTTITIKATVHLTLIQRFHLGVFPDRTLTSGEMSGAPSQAGPRHRVDRLPQTWADLRAGAGRALRNAPETLPGRESAEAESPGRARGEETGER